MPRSEGPPLQKPSTYRVPGSTALADVAEAAAGADEPGCSSYISRRDRGFTRDLVAGSSGEWGSALVLTVDTPCLGAATGTSGINSAGSMAHPSDPGQHANPTDDLPAHRRVYNPLLAPDITWDDLSWLVGLSPVPVITKGHLRADDAARAVDAGVAGIIVSNHGARNLDQYRPRPRRCPGRRPGGRPGPSAGRRRDPSGAPTSSRP